MTSQVGLIPRPKNEPVKNYAPGNPDKVSLKKELDRQASSVQEIPLIIGGERITTSEQDPLVCPHNHHHTLANLHRAGKQDVENAISVACEMQKEWNRMPMLDRGAIFLKAADLLASNFRNILNAATMLGQSKTVYQAEIDAACELIDFFRFNAWYAEKIAAEQPPHSPFGQWNRSEPRGLEGFVFAVGPFNFTSISINLACAPALMGCSVLWKPSPTAMLASWYGLEMLEKAGLPPGVINLVHGDAPMIGDIALNHPDLAGVHFTGSTNTFNFIWKHIGNNIGRYRNYPRLVGETGGKDFIFAHPSAERTNLKTALIRGAFEFQGQKCSAASRAYIPESLWNSMRGDLIAEIDAVKMGDPGDFTNFMSAVIDKRAFDKIKSYIDHAKESNEADVVAGGKCDESEGYFIRPTVILAKNPRYKSMVEEIFGPVLTIYVYKDKDWQAAAIECDQATPYALTGAIFAQERRVINELSDLFRYTAGNFYVNDKPTGAVVGQQPFGGSRGSGTNDKAGSVYNLIRWVSHRTVKENFIDHPDYQYRFMGEN